MADTVDARSVLTRSLDSESTNLTLDPFQRQTTPDESKSKWNTRCFRAVCGLVLHLVGFTANAFFLYAAEEANPIIFAVLAISWFLVGSACARAALQDESVLPSMHPALRIPILVIVFGFFQGMHIWNIGTGTLWRKHARAFHESFIPQTPSRGPSFAMKRTKSGRFDCPTMPVHSKTFEAVTESYVFAYTSLWLFFLSASPSANDAPWEPHVVNWRPWRWFLFTVGWTNMVAIAMGIMEIDYRVGKRLRQQVKSSFLNVVCHFAFRLAEVSVRMIFVVAFTFMFALRRRCEPDYEANAKEYVRIILLLFWHPFVMWIVHAQVLRHAVVPGSTKEPRLAHWALAYVVNITDPATFVDRAGYVVAARRFTGHLYSCRLLEILAMAAGFVWFFAERFPEDCLAEGEPPTVGEHLIWYHKGVLCMWLGIVLVRILTVCFFRGCFRHYSVPIVDDSVIQMKPTSHDREGSVRALKPRGLCSMLLQVSTGLAFKLLYQEERRFDDFVIEAELGCGSYGVVAKVTCEDDFGNPLVFAMKLQNTCQMEEDASDLLCTLEESAGRERDILLQLESPFVMRLLYYFKVPPTQQYRYASTGEDVEDKKQSRVFHRAIIMEFLELGDLEQYVLAQAFTKRERDAPRTARPRENTLGELELSTMDGTADLIELHAGSGTGASQLTATEFAWLLLMRKFSAELLLVLEFVHSKAILYRDLKPANLLLRANRWGKLHVVLGDFGLSKQIQPARKEREGEGARSERARRSFEEACSEEREGEGPAGEEDEGASSVGLEARSRTFGKLDSLAGTMRYAAPEVLDIAHRKARRRYTPAVDLFSFGKTVLVILWRSKQSEKSRGLLMPDPTEYMKAIDLPPLAHELIWETTSRDPLKRGTAFGQQKHAFFDNFNHGGAAFPRIDFKSLPVEASDL